MGTRDKNRKKERRLPSPSSINGQQEDWWTGEYVGWKGEDDPDFEKDFKNLHRKIKNSIGKYSPGLPEIRAMQMVRLAIYFDFKKNAKKKKEKQD